MATQETTGTQAGGSQIIGQATIVYGSVQAISPEGVTRILQPNDPIYFNDRIMTGNDGAVSIVFNDAGQTRLDLGRMTDMVIDQEVFGGAAPEDVAAAAAEVEQIQQALLEGEEFDPTTDLEATAAGPAAGVQEAGGGQTTVRIERVNQEVTPESGAETTGISRSFLDPEAGILGPQPPVAPIPPAPAPAAPVVFAALDAEADTDPTAGDLVETIDEANLAEGTDPGGGPTTVTGTLSFDFGPDVPGILVFGPQQIVIDSNGDSITVPGTYNDLIVNDDGTYSYTLSDNIFHPNAGATGSDDVLSDVFSFIAYDSDGVGSTGAPGSLTINILDDGPEVVGDTTRVVEEEAMNFFESPDAGAGNTYPTLSQGNPDEDDGPEDSDYNDPYQNDVRQVTGDLNTIIDLGADDDLPDAKFTIDGTKLEGLPALVSKGGQVLYRMNANGTTLEAYVEDGGYPGFPSIPVSFDQSQEIRVPPENGEYQEGERIVFTLDVQPDGTYTFTVYDQLDHLEGDGENIGLRLYESDGSVDSIDFSSVISGTDSDFDPIPGLPEETFNFIVVDDVPELVPIGEPDYPEQGGEEFLVSSQIGPERGIARFEVQEDALSQESPDTINPFNNPDEDSSTGNLDTNLDTDSAVYNLNALVRTGGDENLTWSLVEPESEEPGEVELESDPAGIPSGLSSKGEEVFYRIDGNTLTAYTDSVDNVFTFSVDPVTGLAVFNLNDQLDHPDGAGDEALLAIDNLGQFVRATDFDGDFVELDGRIMVRVENDVPEQGGEPVVAMVDEDDLDTVLSTGSDDDDPGYGPRVVAEGSLSSVISTGADEPLSFSFDTYDDDGSTMLTAEAEAALTGQGLTSQSDELFYRINANGDLVGRATNEEGDSRTVFRLQLDEDGTYKFILRDQLDHPDGDGENSLFIDFSAVVNAADFDQDTINLGDLDFGDYPAFSVEVVDDVPVAGAGPVMAKVDEDDLDTMLSTGTDDDDPGYGPQVVAEGSLSSLVKSGADEPISFSFDTYDDDGTTRLNADAEAALEGQGLKSQGDDLFYRINASGDLVGRATNEEGDSRTVFRLELDEDGTYKFVLRDQLDHPDGDGENSLNIDFSAAVNATDFDNDTVNLADLDFGDQNAPAFSIEVVDDVPEVIETAQYYFISEYAGYNNVIGTYELNENGEPVNPQIIVPESNDLANFSQADPTFNYGDDGNPGPGNEYTEGVDLGQYEDGTKMFLIADGAKNNDFPVDSQLSFREGGPGEPPWVLQVNGEDVDGLNGVQGVYFMDSYLDSNPIDLDDYPGSNDPDSGTHFTDQWAVSPWPQRFINEVPIYGGEVRIEDLNLGDGDFDDTVLRVEKGPVVSESHLDDGTKTDPNPNTTASGNFFTASAAGIQFVTGADEPLMLNISSSGIYTPDGFVDGGDADVEVEISEGADPGDPTVINSSSGQLKVWANGDWEYTLTDNTTVHPDNDKGSADKHDGDYDRFAADQVQDVFAITATDYDGDSVDTNFIVNINDDGPVAEQQVEPIMITVEEDDMSLASADPGPDQSEGINEDGSDNLDEASGDGAASLSSLFNIGADNDPGLVEYGLSDLNIGNLPQLTSQGREISYEITRVEGGADTLTATADGGGTVFTLAVNPDGSWDFDLQDQLDHVDQVSPESEENFDLRDGNGSVPGLDFSSLVTATDADGDTAVGAADGSFVVQVQDDVPEAKGTDQVPANLNLMLVMDKSGSMSTNIKFDGANDVSRMAALQTAVVSLLATLEASAAENVRVHLVSYDTNAYDLGTFDIKKDGNGGYDITAAETAVNAMSANGFTNYEAAFQQGLQWTDPGYPGIKPLEAGDVTGDLINQVIFFSDGDPNRYNDPDQGEPGGPDPDSGTATESLDQVTGGDGTNELQALIAWADSVRSVGINVNNSQDDRLDILDSTGDALNIDDAGDLIAILPDLVSQPAPIITASVTESEMDPVDAVPIPDNADGTSGPGSGDEASGGNLSDLFMSGADEPLSFSLDTEVGDLPVLYSGGVLLAYEVVGNATDGYTLVARSGDAAGPTVFTFSVEADGSWSFDLQGALDHEAGNGQNFELLSEGGTIDGIDLSSIIRATDYDGDTVPATPGAFVVEVGDDVPVVEMAAQNAILADEPGNSLVADLNVDPGADNLSKVAINPLDDSGSKLSDGDPVYSNGEPYLVNGQQAVWQYNDSDGSWNAVLPAAQIRGGQQPQPVILFTVAPEKIGGEFTGNYTVEQGDFEVVPEKGFDINLKSGNPPGGKAPELVRTDGSLKVTFTADNPGLVGTDEVNWSNQGIGVSNNFIDEDSIFGSEILKMSFTDADDNPLNMTEVRVELDHLDAGGKFWPPDEVARWKAFSYDDDGNRIMVGEGSIEGEGNGASESSDQILEIKITDADGETVTFQEVEMSYQDDRPLNNDEGYRVESVSGSYEDPEAQEFEFSAEITDGDGDTVETDFEVSFDGDGDIEGTDADEVIAGSSEDDIIDGGGGDDLILAGDGDDTVDGGEGNDIIDGGDGEDTIDGGDGDDVLHGGADDDKVVGGDGEDEVSGGDGDDTVYGDAEPPAPSDDAKDTFDDSDAPAEYADYDPGEDEIDNLVPPVDPTP